MATKPGLEPLGFRHWRFGGNIPSYGLPSGENAATKPIWKHLVLTIGDWWRHSFLGFWFLGECDHLANLEHLGFYNLRFVATFLSRARFLE